MDKQLKALLHLVMCLVLVFVYQHISDSVWVLVSGWMSFLWAMGLLAFPERTSWTDQGVGRRVR
jgi:predicted RND superfamily exporter protein